MNKKKTRRREIKRQKIFRELQAHKLKLKLNREIPLDAIEADPSQMNLGNTYSRPPEYYLDYVYKCCGCGKKSIWTAEQQKWWYEVAKGFIHSVAIRCDECRLKIKNKKLAQKKHMEEMLKIKPHKNEEFFKTKF
jgi:hypothetical protein